MLRATGHARMVTARDGPWACLTLSDLHIIRSESRPRVLHLKSREGARGVQYMVTRSTAGEWMFCPTCCPLVRFSHIWHSSKGSVKDAARDLPGDPRLCCSEGNVDRGRAARQRATSHARMVSEWWTRLWSAGNTNSTPASTLNSHNFIFEFSGAMGMTFA